MKKEKSQFVSKLDKLYKELYGIKMNHNDTIESLVNQFYDIMRKYGIKQGTWTGRGSRLVSNAEWNICWQVFLNNYQSSLNLACLLHEVPEDLLAYGEKPKIKK